MDQKLIILPVSLPIDRIYSTRNNLTHVWKEKYAYIIPEDTFTLVNITDD